MKIGDKLIYKFDKYFDLEDVTINAFYFNKSYEIIDINDSRCYFIDELGNRDFFNIENENYPYYIWNYFYTTEEMRLKKLNSL